jgi:hypothetical protein
VDKKTAIMAEKRGYLRRNKGQSWTLDQLVQVRILVPQVLLGSSNHRELPQFYPPLADTQPPIE